MFHKEANMAQVNYTSQICYDMHHSRKADLSTRFFYKLISVLITFDDHNYIIVRSYIFF